jgi:hypothetical protein
MALHFLGGETGNEGSPRLWEDGTDLLVQGYVVDDEPTLDQVRLPAGEGLVRVPWSLMKYLPPHILKQLPEESDGASGS